MTSQELAAAILSPSADTRQILTRHVNETRIATVRLLVDAYCESADDLSAQQLIGSNPELILVDMQHREAALHSISVLHVALPDASLYAYGSLNNPEWIIEAMQAGAREYFGKPISTGTAAMAFGRYLDQRQRLMQQKKLRGTIFGIIGAKGGVGATTIAVNLAAALATAPESRVSILDLNSVGGDAAPYLNLQPRFFLSDAISNASRLDVVLLHTFMTSGGKIAILASKQYSYPTAINVPAIAKLLRVSSHAHTHTIIDLPWGSSEEIVQTVAAACEVVLLVIPPELSAISRASWLLNILSDCGCLERARLVINRHDLRKEDEENEISRTLDRRIYWRLPNNYRAVVRAIDRGVPLIGQNRSELESSFRKLAEDLTGTGMHKRHHFLSWLPGSRGNQDTQKTA